jgi:putative membrane protein
MPIQLLAKQIGLEHARNLIGSLIPMNQLPELLVSTLAFSIIGLLLFSLAFWIMEKATPFSVRKEIEEDQNTALAIVIASVIIGIALIVSAAVHG